MPGVTLCSVTLLACRSQRLRSALKRSMLTGAVSGATGPSVVTYTPSASSSVFSDAVCSYNKPLDAASSYQRPQYAPRPRKYAQCSDAKAQQ